ncbi:MAG: tRNA (5-methylaminomethyl-2-thiouridine)(34)-methyltransferase MnmD [Pseudomonadota bacterium]
MAWEKPDLAWEAGNLPVSTRFADPYFARSDGLAESRHVFLAGNDLPARFRPGFHIAELGFGTGLNFLAAWQAWCAQGLSGSLRFTSFERYPLGAADMARALARWPELAALTQRLCAAWAGPGRYSLPGAELEVIGGDAGHVLPHWTGAADAWFLDGFSPARNPQMWTPDLMAALARRTRAGGSFATYSAAGHVRRALSAAGFAVRKRPGFGAKREMCAGSRPGADRDIAPVA